MASWNAVKNWATHTQMWGIPFIALFILVFVVLGVREERANIVVASTLLKGEPVDGWSAFRVQYVVRTGFGELSFLKAGFTKAEIRCLQGWVRCPNGIKFK